MRSVALFDDIAEMYADAEIDAPVGRQAGIALSHAVLHLDRATHRLDDAVEFDQSAVAGALDDASAMHGDGGIDQITAQRPQPRQGAIFVGAGKPAVADNVGRQDCRDFSRLGHATASPRLSISQRV
jgi:hypothetical protein